MTKPSELFFKAQQALGPTAPKIAQNPHFRSGYCPLWKLMEIVREALEPNDLYLTQPMAPATRDGYVRVITRIKYKLTGEVVEESDFEIPTPSSDPQKATAAVTYARRTSITSLMGIAEADDDGNEASSTAEKKAKPPAPTKVPIAEQRAALEETGAQILGNITKKPGVALQEVLANAGLSPTGDDTARRQLSGLLHKTFGLGQTYGPDKSPSTQELMDVWKVVTALPPATLANGTETLKGFLKTMGGK